MGGGGSTFDATGFAEAPRESTPVVAQPATTSASAGGAERKDTTRFAADGNSRTGWQDGLAICRRK